MPYQSILSGPIPGVKNTGAYNSIVAGFVPGRNNAGPAAGTFVPKAGDTRNLTGALQNLHMFKPDDQVRVIQRATQAGLLHRDHASSLVSGILNNQQGANTQGFKQPGILGALPTNPLINHSAGVTNFVNNVPGAVKTLGQAINSPVAPLENKVVQQFKYLSGPKASPQEQLAFMKNQNLPVPKGSPTNVGVAAGIQAQKMIAAGAKPADVKAFLDKSSKAQSDNTKRMAGTAVSLASFAVGGGAAAGAKGLTGAVRAAVPTAIAGAAGNEGATLANNPNATSKELGNAGAFGFAAGALPLVGAGVSAGLRAVFQTGAKDFLKASKVARLAQIGEDANKPVKVPVTDASSPTSVGVRTPTKVPIEATPTADKITVRTPQRMTDPQFNKEFNRLSRGYDVETKQLQTAAPTLAPRQVQTAAQAIDDKYQGKLNNLVETYHNPPLSEPVAPKPMRVPKEASPKSVTVKNPVTNVATTETPLFKEAPPAKEAPSSANVPGSLKTSGSSVKLDKEFVQKGITQRMEDLPEFETINKADQAAKATKLVNEDRQKAIDIVQGRTSAPDGLHPVAVHNALVAAVRKEGNGDLAEIVAKAQTNRELSAHGQGLSLAAERDPHDPIEAIRQIAAIKQKTAERLNGKGGLTAKTTDEVKAIKAARSTVAPTKQDWHSFVESLKC